MEESSNQTVVHKQLEDEWREDINNKSSLKYLNHMKVKVGTVHHLYSTARHNMIDRQRADIKARFLTGTYTLQGNRAFKVDPTCKMCKQEPETREHVTQYAQHQKSKAVEELK